MMCSLALGWCTSVRETVRVHPGLPVTYVAFFIIMLGVSLAAVPHRHVWAAFESDTENGNTMLFGGTSRKAKVGFERSIDKIAAKLGATANVEHEAATANVKQNGEMN